MHTPERHGALGEGSKEASTAPFGPRWMAWMGRHPYLCSAVLATLSALLVYVILPVVGLGFIKSQFTLSKLLKYAFLGVGGVAYLYAVTYVIPRRPIVLVVFALALWPILAFLREVVLNTVGVSLKINLIVALVLPPLTALFFMRYWRHMFTKVPIFAMLAVFYGLFLFYFVFNNLRVHTPQAASSVETFGGLISISQLNVLTYIMVAVILGAVTLLSSLSPRLTFDTINRWIIGFLLAESLLTIAGYALGWFVVEVDGFNRSRGVYQHPNAFAHHMGVLLLYVGGLYFYYQQQVMPRVRQNWIVGALIVGCIAFFHALSKAAMGSVGLFALIMLMMNLQSEAVRRRVPYILGTVVTFAIFGPLVYQLVTGTNLIGVIQARIADSESLQWRLNTWGDLMALMDNSAVVFGNGLTAANEYILKMYYDTERYKEPLIMAHNTYIQLFYDMGLLGLTYVAAMITMFTYGVRHYFKTSKLELKPLFATITLLSAYFIIISGVDEVFTMFNMPMMFWLLVTILYGYTQRRLAASVAKAHDEATSSVSGHFGNEVSYHG